MVVFKGVFDTPSFALPLLVAAERETLRREERRGEEPECNIV